MAELTFVWEAGTEPWLPSAELARRIAGTLERPVVVTWFHRRSLPEIWAEVHGGEALTLPAYAFRAWARKGHDVAYIALDPTETLASATWLLLHELTHLMLPGAGLVQAACDLAPKPRDYMTSDEAHEAVLEEQLCNAVANAWLSSLGCPGGPFDRVWWRARTPGA